MNPHFITKLTFFAKGVIAGAIVGGGFVWVLTGYDKDTSVNSPSDKRGTFKAQLLEEKQTLPHNADIKQKTAPNR